MRINGRKIAGVVNWCCWYICPTQDFKLYPEDPKKFMGHGIAPIYAGIHFVCISGKICRVCWGTGWLSCILSQNVTLNSDSIVTAQKLEFGVLCHVSETLSTTLADLPGNTNKVYACIYRCYPMPHEFFRVFRVQFEVLSRTYVSATPIYHTGYLPAIDSHGGIS
jgi:hypothetical protein